MSKRVCACVCACEFVKVCLCMFRERHLVVRMRGGTRTFTQQRATATTSLIAKSLWGFP